MTTDSLLDITGIRTDISRTVRLTEPGGAFLCRHPCLPGRERHGARPMGQEHGTARADISRFTATPLPRSRSRPGRFCLIGVLHTPPISTGYSPQHMHRPGEGRGTITVRSTTLLALMEDAAPSLIHHGFNRIVFVNGHGSNIKVVDPVLRKLRYETGALIGLVSDMGSGTQPGRGDLREPAGGDPEDGNSSERETSQCLAWNEDLVRMDRAEAHPHIRPYFLPASFRKFDGAPDVEFEGYTYFNFPMDHHEFTETGVIGNPMRATKEKGEESFRRYSRARGSSVLEHTQVPVKVENREFVNRVM